MIINRSIPNGHSGKGFFFIFSTYINPHLMHFGYFLSVLGSHEMNCPFSGNSTHNSLAGNNINPSPRNHASVMSTNGIKIKKTLRTDMLNNQTKFINVSGKHKSGPILFFQSSMATTQSVDEEIIRNRSDIIFYNGPRFIFIT